VGRTAVRETAPSLEVGQEDPLVRIEHLGGFRHEVDTAKDDGSGPYLCSCPGQLEAVAGEVSQLLNLAFLVIVSQNRCVFANLEGCYFVKDVVHEEGPLVFRVAEG